MGNSTLVKVRKALMGTPYELRADVVELPEFVAISIDNRVDAKDIKSYLFMKGCFWGWEQVKLIPNNQTENYLVLVEKGKDE